MNDPAITYPTPRRLDATQALWLKGAILMTFLAASTVPSPLYALYRAMWGFSPVMLTVVFASYAIAMLLALLVFGALSDYRGRREVVLASLVLEIGALILFWRADSVGWLLAARVLQGFATGIATSALGAGLVDLHRERGALMNSVAPMVGLGVGGLGSSVLVQFAPAPTRLVFDVLLLVFAVFLVAAAFLPETAQRRPGAWKSLLPSVDVPAKARATMLRVLPVNTAQWAMAGFYLSLGPTLARTVTGDDAPVVGGFMIAALSLTSAAAIALARRIAPRQASSAGAAGLAVGVVVTLAGLHWRSPGLALAGTVVSGAGFGSAFSGSLRSLVPLALPAERAALMAAFFVASYLAFSLPAIAAGLLTSRLGLEPTAIVYGLGAALLALTVFLPARVPRPAGK
ncbi:MFS transporter [Ramlibacter montanisoli]|uniref:MFS transporter n=1 Tax=Ramlibacter montanisoli TaxID=2732512 RepID=A0A849K0G7_9BURK|nr:MFS transporter [Ramlibacter montanisoli]NNU42018.1 MFS transporter [Ramlibacter montanisoli]